MLQPLASPSVVPASVEKIMSLHFRENIYRCGICKPSHEAQQAADEHEAWVCKMLHKQVFIGNDLCQPDITDSLTYTLQLNFVGN
jgi:hypothetical protein